MSKKQNGKAMQNYREEIVQNTSVSEEALHNRKQKKAFRQISSVLSILLAVVLFYTLMKPAITMENRSGSGEEVQLICGLAEHAHTEACYGYDHEEADPVYAVHRELECPFVPHVHDETCYDASGNLICGISEEYYHVHDENCYDLGTLVCNLAEHAPDAETETQETRALICGRPESAGHVHSDSCYAVTYLTNEQPICGKEESGPHTHSEDCYGLVLICNEDHEHTDECFTEGLVCGLEEGPGHVHSLECYPSIRQLACGMEESEGHVHTEECYAYQTIAYEPHVHTDACYVDGTLVCGLTEIQTHQHTDACWNVTQVLISGGHRHNKECEKVLLCQLPEHEHTRECYSGKTELVEEMLQSQAMELTGETLAGEGTDAATVQEDNTTAEEAQAQEEKLNEEASLAAESVQTEAGVAHDDALILVSEEGEQDEEQLAEEYDLVNEDPEWDNESASTEEQAFTQDQADSIENEDTSLNVPEESADQPEAGTAEGENQAVPEAGDKETEPVIQGETENEPAAETELTNHEAGTETPGEPVNPEEAGSGEQDQFTALNYVTNIVRTEDGQFSVQLHTDEGVRVQDVLKLAGLEAEQVSITSDIDFLEIGEDYFACRFAFDEGRVYLTAGETEITVLCTFVSDQDVQAAADADNEGQQGTEGRAQDEAGDVDGISDTSDDNNDDAKDSLNTDETGNTDSTTAVDESSKEEENQAEGNTDTENAGEENTDAAQTLNNGNADAADGESSDALDGKIEDGQSEAVSDEADAVSDGSESGNQEALSDGTEETADSANSDVETGAEGEDGSKETTDAADAENQAAEEQADQAIKVLLNGEATEQVRAELDTEDTQALMAMVQGYLQAEQGNTSDETTEENDEVTEAQIWRVLRVSSEDAFEGRAEITVPVNEEFASVIPEHADMTSVNYRVFRVDAENGEVISANDFTVNDDAESVKDFTLGTDEAGVYAFVCTVSYAYREYQAEIELDLSDFIVVPEELSEDSGISVLTEGAPENLPAQGSMMRRQTMSKQLKKMSSAPAPEASGVVIDMQKLMDQLEAQGIDTESEFAGIRMSMNADEGTDMDFSGMSQESSDGNVSFDGQSLKIMDNGTVVLKGKHITVTVRIVGFHKAGETSTYEFAFGESKSLYMSEIFAAVGMPETFVPARFNFTLSDDSRVSLAWEENDCLVTANDFFDEVTLNIERGWYRAVILLRNIKPVDEEKTEIWSEDRTVSVTLKDAIELPEGTKPAAVPSEGVDIHELLTADFGENADVQLKWFDISLGDVHEISATVTLPGVIELPENPENRVMHVDARVYHVQEEGIHTLNAAVNGSDITFETDGFSQFGIAWVVTFENTQTGETYTLTLPGAEDIPLAEVLKGIGMAGDSAAEAESEAQTETESAAEFEKRIKNVESTNAETVLVTKTEESWIIRIVKEGDALLAITLDDDTVIVVDVDAHGVTEKTSADESVVISTVNKLYLPEDVDVKAELVEDAAAETAIDAVKAENGDSEIAGTTEAGKTAYTVFDISLENVDVDAYEGFKVNVKLPEKVIGKDFRLYHIHDGKTEEIEIENLGLALAENGQEAVAEFSFETKNFSEFVLSYTVDFEYEVDGQVYQYSISGGGKIELSELLDVLGVVEGTSFDSVDAFLYEIENVEFSDYELLRLTKIGENWLLESLHPFTTEEVLAIYMKNGNVLKVKVTDAQSDFSTDTYTNVESYTPVTADITTDTDINYNSGLQMYEANVTTEFTLPTETVKEKKNFYIALSEDIVIPDSALGVVRYAVDKGEKLRSFEYYFVKGNDGKYYLAIEYLDTYLNQVSIIKKNTISLDLLIANLHKDSEDKSHFSFTDNVPITVDNNEINYPGNENADSNISVDKSYSGMNTTSMTIDGESKTVTYVDYTVTVTSTKGTGQDISLTDAMSGLYFQYNHWQNQPISVADVQVQSVTSSGAGITDNSYTFTKGDNGSSFELGLKEIGDQGGTYTVTYRYYLDTEIPSELEAGQTYMIAGGKNNVTVEAGTITDHDSDGFDVQKSNQPVTVNKTGSYNSETQKITWTITLQLKNGDHDLFDEMFAEANAGSLQITREEAGNFTTTTSDDGKTIHFNDPGTYTITYTTDAAPDMYSSYRVNNTTRVDNNDNYKGEAGVDVPKSGEGTVDKTLEESELVSTSNGIETYVLTWQLNFSLPDSLKKGTVLKDTLTLNHSNADYYTYHRFTEDQKTELISALESVFGSDAFDVEINQRDGNDYEIVLTLKEDWTKPSGAGQTASISYSTTATVDQNFANPGLSSSLNKDSYKNSFRIGDVEGHADFKYTKEVNKVDYDYRDGTKVTNHTVTRENNELKWAIIINPEADYDTMKITDMLPAGLTVSRIMVGGEYNLDTFTPVDGTNSFGWSSGNHDMKDNVSSITATKSASGTDIVVNVAVTDEANRSQYFREGTLFYVVIYATVDSSEFDAVSTESKAYTNHVSVTGNDKPLGEDDQTQVVTLDSQSISKTTVKSAIGDLDSAQEEWEQYHYLSYGVVINEDGHTMNGGQPFSMEDVLSFNKVSPDGKDISFSLAPNSVRLQRRNSANDPWVDISSSDWTYQFIETKDGDMRHKTISVANLPDNTQLRLVYTYQVEIDNPEAGESYDLGAITNVATIHGARDYSITHHEEKSWSEFNSTASTSSSNSLTLSKVDLSDYNKLLPGTKFVLEKWNGTKWVIIDAISEESIYLTQETDPSKFGAAQTNNIEEPTATSYTVYQTASTTNNKNGSLRFYMPTFDPGHSDYTGAYFDAGVVYRAREYEAPQIAGSNYIVESDPDKQPSAYFYFSKNEKDEPFEGTISWPSDKIQNLADDLSRESDTFYITNAEKPSIKVTKKFAGDADITEAQKKAMSITVYWVGNDGTVNTSDDQLVKTFTYDDILQNKNVITSDDSDLIQNGRNYYAIEKGITLLGTEWTASYILNSGVEETGLSATSSFDENSTVTSGSFPIVNNVGTVDFINKYDSIKTSIEVTKEWVDYQNHPVTNPSSNTIKFQVYQVKEGEVSGTLYIPKGSTVAQTYEVTFDTTLKTWGTTEVTDLPKNYVENGELKTYTYYVVETEPIEYLTTTYKHGENGEYGAAESAATGDADQPITIKNTEDEPPHFSVTKQWFDSDGSTDYTGKTTAEHVYFRVMITTASATAAYNPVANGVLSSDPTVYNEEKYYYIIDKIDNGDGTYSWETLDVRFPENLKLYSAPVLSFYIQEVNANGDPLTTVNTVYSFNNNSLSDASPVSLERGDLGDAVITNVEKYKLKVTKKWYDSEGNDVSSTITEPTKIDFNIIVHKKDGSTAVFYDSLNGYNSTFSVNLVDKADGTGKEWSTFEIVLPEGTDVDYYEVKETTSLPQYQISYVLNDEEVTDASAWETVKPESYADVVIENTEKEKLTIHKFWSDDGNNRPGTVKVKLYRQKDGGTIDTAFTWPYSNSPYTIEGGSVGQRDNGKIEIELKAENNWTVTIQGLEKGEENAPWKYYVEESLSGYTANITDGVLSNGTIEVTNIKDVPETSVAVQKTWDVNNEALKKDVSVKLMQIKGIPEGNKITVKFGRPYTTYDSSGVAYSSPVTAIVGNGDVTISYASWNKDHDKIFVNGAELSEAQYGYNSNQGKQEITLHNVNSSIDVDVLWPKVNYVSAPSYETKITGEPASSVTIVGDPIAYGNAYTLTASENWYHEWKNLPASDDQYVYYYYVVEDPVPNGMTVSYSADNGATWKETLSFEDAVAGGKTFQVKNTEDEPQTGSLKLTKEVTVNGSETTTNKADGAYVFSITGPDPATTVVKYVQITVTNGKATSYKVADGPDAPDDWTSLEAAGTFAANAVTREAVVSGLAAGDYTITETTVDGMTTTVSGGKENKNNETANTITVTVTAGENIATAAQVTFTNDKMPMTSFNFNKIWLEASGNVEMSSFYQDWQENITVTIKRKQGASGAEDSNFSLNYTIAENEGTFTATMDASASKIPEGEGTLNALTLTGSGSGKVFNFELPKESLRKYNDDGTEWVYYVVESEVPLYVTSYGTSTTVESTTTYSVINGASDAKDGGVIVNQTFGGYELPSTGGPGTRLYTVLGSILILGAGVLLWRRRRLI